jgi:K+/H+ antiporter YhaU regulatory subunit KhtT
MAISALQPVVVEFIDTLSTGEVGEAVLAEIEVSEESGLAGQTIGEILQGCKTIVTLGVHKKSGSINVAPALTSLVEVGDRIIVMGEEKELEAVHPADRPLRPRQQAPSHRPRPVG